MMMVDGHGDGDGHCDGDGDGHGDREMGVVPERS